MPDIRWLVYLRPDGRYDWFCWDPREPLPDVVAGRYHSAGEARKAAEDLNRTAGTPTMELL